MKNVSKFKNPLLFISTLLAFVFSFFHRTKCSHLFDPLDMQSRDEDGNVKWECCKCHQLFIEHCGLDILKHGKCTGRWGLSK